MAWLEHPKLSRTLRELASTDGYRKRCAESPPPLLVRGIREFNTRKFFDCHETLEELWRAEDDPIRYLYQGILHVGVGYYHWERGNHHGAVTKLGSGIELLQFYRPRCQGVEIEPLLGTALAARDALLELGKERMGDLDASLVPEIVLSTEC